MGVQRQQERWAFLNNAYPRMPVPVDASLVPFGLPKPTLQIQVVLEAWQRVSTDDESSRSPTTTSTPESFRFSACAWPWEP